VRVCLVRVRAAHVLSGKSESCLSGKSESCAHAVCLVRVRAVCLVRVSACCLSGESESVLPSKSESVLPSKIESFLVRVRYREARFLSLSPLARHVDDVLSHHSKKDAQKYTALGCKSRHPPR